MSGVHWTVNLWICKHHPQHSLEQFLEYAQWLIQKYLFYLQMGHPNSFQQPGL